ncbi:hypothetical protein ACOME3_003623 [Neoechinorhynchus agilis]
MTVISLLNIFMKRKSVSRFSEASTREQMSDLLIFLLTIFKEAFCTNGFSKCEQMGAKKTKPLDEGDIKAFSNLTGIDQFAIRGLSLEFQKHSKNGLMNKKQFREMYCELTPGSDPESSLKLRKIANRVFKAFDKDESGYLTFDEFTAAYVMLREQGAARTKMEFLVKQILNSTGEMPASINTDQARTLLNGLDAGYEVQNANKAFDQLIDSATQETIPMKKFMDTALQEDFYGDVLNRNNI